MHYGSRYGDVCRQGPQVPTCPMVTVEQEVNSNGVARFKLHVTNSEASDLYKIFMTTRFTSIPTSLNVQCTFHVISTPTALL